MANKIEITTKRIEDLFKSLYSQNKIKYPVKLNPYFIQEGGVFDQMWEIYDKDEVTGWEIDEIEKKLTKKGLIDFTI